jgi:EAL domain-containing protein (putative c-di-GMP-specific phosphodiesterase class I)/GGDEF domain-containing protein
MSDAPPDDGAGPILTVEEERRLRAALLRLRSGLYDPVTGLCSYALKIEELRARLEGRRLGVLVLDLPELGSLEAIHGWEAADRLLAGVASLLEALRGRAFPASTLLALDGVYGNSFVLFQQEGEGDGEVTGADLARSGAALCGALRARLASAPWAPPSARLDFTVGYALVSASASARFERLVHRGIREARDMTQRQADRIVRERAVELRSILNEARLTTHYQPIVDLERGAVMGYEALTRGPLHSWFEGPEALFSISDSIRVSAELDALCCRQAVRNARGFDPEKKLFLNALPGALEGRGFFNGAFRSALQEIDLRPGNLVLEISERTGIEDFEAFGRELALVRREGFLVAIDDVGTGYSSLQAITELQPDYLKIDISLVKNIHQSLIKQELVRSLLQVAARLGAQVIAEGIESAAEYRTLRGCGVRYGQGFYLARPAPSCSPRLVRDEGAAS